LNVFVKLKYVFLANILWLLFM